jgi:competence protein ComEC
VLDPGLWLSFGAVAVILAVVAGRRAPAGKLSRTLLRIQAALFVGLLVCTAAWFGRVSLVAPLANLLAVPWFSILVVPPALAGVALSWLSPALGGLLLLFAAQATEFGLAAIELAAGCPWRRAGCPRRACWRSARPASARRGACCPGRRRAARWRPCCSRRCCSAGRRPWRTGNTSCGCSTSATASPCWSAPGHRALLYDAGPSWPGGDAAAWTVLPAMRALAVNRLDALVVSHGHADHMGGVGSVLAGRIPARRSGAASARSATTTGPAARAYPGTGTVCGSASCTRRRASRAG